MLLYPHSCSKYSAYISIIVCLERKKKTNSEDVYEFPLFVTLKELKKYTFNSFYQVLQL